MQKGFGSVHEPIAYTSQAQNRFDQLKVVLDEKTIVTPYHNHVHKI